MTFPTPGDLPDSGIEFTSLVSPALADGFFTTVQPEKPMSLLIFFKSCVLTVYLWYCFCWGRGLPPYYGQVEKWVQVLCFISERKGPFAATRFGVRIQAFHYAFTNTNTRTSLVAQTVKHLPTVQETWIQSLGWEDLLEKDMATHSSILSWRIPWTEEPGGLQSMGSQRVGHDWATSLSYVQNVEVQ